MSAACHGSDLDEILNNVHGAPADEAVRIPFGGIHPDRAAWGLSMC